MTALKSLCLILFALLSFPNVRAEISVTPECWAWIHNQDTGDFAESRLLQSSFDKHYYAAELGQYAFGADYSYLPQDGIGLIVFDKQSHRNTTMTAGFRRLGKTKHYEATVKFYDQNELGQTQVAGILCGYEAP